MTKTFIFVVNNPEYFISHRLPVGLTLLKQGHHVHVMGPGDCPKSLLEYGFTFHAMPMSRKGKNVFQELNTLYSLYLLFKQIRPDLIHLVTIKPYLYGGIAARLARVPAVVSAVAGLGTLFIGKNFKFRLLRSLLFPVFRLAFFHKNQIVIFQNNDDRLLLTDWLNINQNKTFLIRGSGVDLNAYTFISEPLTGKPVITFASRLLFDKGLAEFVEAIKLLNGLGVEAFYQIVGDIDLGNPSSATDNDIQAWRSIPNLNILGYQDDMAAIFKDSNLVVLPSYREGLPKVLIEAAACGRAVVTTDVPGCRDAIIPDITGLLVPVKDSAALAGAIEQLVRDPALRMSMGVAGRHLAEESFSIEQVVEQHLSIYQQII